MLLKIKRRKDTKAVRRQKQLIRRKMIQKFVTDKKIYKRSLNKDISTEDKH